MNIVQQNQAASQSQTGFYSWFQMPCGTSGTAAITTSATEVVIFPNPAKEHLNIKLNGVASDLKITLVDITGRIVAKLYDNDSEETKISLALPPLANGVYLVNIELNNTRLPIQKITINN